ncbi:MAG TPA: 5-formyltetrahydrofolate cyclo-ligase [Microbacterium sp.]|uniref:5-formyltetrahydrofolate cyclo-ligase n=1 Tax=Microbacterium sp. TaxID=51671 RepID=UPI002B4976EB|nr:5-formyltetrahydrofolate cyclo-ligase [Microbacterium sp.]HKT56865.1 5-formyltetrahydrofolate cyclo-ligase [Microbacterium sp.]
MSDAIQADKRALRAELRERRNMMSEQSRDAAAAGIRTRLDELVELHRARSVSCYLSTPTEPGTRAFVAAALERGIRVLLPISRSDGLLDWTVATADDEFTEGPFGIEEPTGELLGPIAVNDVDLMLIPAAAVDPTGMRLGWGRGYFDKTLGSMARRPPVYAIVYDSEVLDEVPSDELDQSVTGIVTPTRILTLAPERR